MIAYFWYLKKIYYLQSIIGIQTRCINNSLLLVFENDISMEAKSSWKDLHLLFEWEVKILDFQGFVLESFNPSLNSSLNIK